MGDICNYLSFFSNRLISFTSHMEASPRILIDSEKIRLIIDRLCYQLIENHKDFSNVAIVGIQPRGTAFAERIVKRLKELDSNLAPKYASLDPTFYRDDFRTKENPIIPSSTEFDFLVDDMEVVLIDDVFFTGRTVRAAIDALVDFGRPAKVDLLTLINRRFSRELPIQPDYVGDTVDAIASEIVKVVWGENSEDNQVLLYTENNSKR